MDFTNQKLQRLQHVDLSRKGSIDAPILELVTYLNACPGYFTTSSCSGRTIVFQPVGEELNDHNHTTNNDELADNNNETQVKVGKKGCQWLFVSHDDVSPTQTEESLEEVRSSDGDAVFKFEAMVMHVQCQSLELAQRLHQAAMSSGFRNSGISIGAKKKIIVGIRSTHSLEAPISCKGQLMVSPQYYSHLVDSANGKMEENRNRIHRFFENVKQMMERPNYPPVQGRRERKKEERRKERQEKLEQRKTNTNTNSSNLIDFNDLTTNTEASEMSTDKLSANNTNTDLNLFLFENT